MKHSTKSVQLRKCQLQYNSWISSIMTIEETAFIPLHLNCSTIICTNENEQITDTYKNYVILHLNSKIYKLNLNKCGKVTSQINCYTISTMETLIQSPSKIYWYNEAPTQCINYKNNGLSNQNHGRVSLLWKNC